MKIVEVHKEDNSYRKKLVKNLISFNNQFGSLERWEYVGFYALDDKGELLGGVQGSFEWDWVHIAHLWVKEQRCGLGKTLMQKIEDYAKEKGKTGIQLDTYDFQARPFYEKMGYSVFGTIENAAGKYAHYYMAKRLVK